MSRRSFMYLAFLTATLLAVSVVFTGTPVQPVAQAQAASSPSVRIVNGASGKVVIKKGSRYALKAKASRGKLSFKTSKSKIVTVTKKGVLKAKRTGKAVVTVTARYGKAKSKKKLRVCVVASSKYKKPKKIKLKVSKKIRVSKTAKITVKFTPKNTSNKNVVFKSSKPKVASVSATGVITAKKPGTVKITVRSCVSKRVKKTVKVKVLKRKGKPDKAAYVKGVRIVNGYDATISKGGTKAVVKQGALPRIPKKGTILVVADDNLQGTAIKVKSTKLNASGTYTVKGTKPKFKEVFKSVKVSKHMSPEEGTVTWLADGVSLSSDKGLKVSASAGGGSTGLKIASGGSNELGTLRLSVGKDFFKKNLKSNKKVSVSGSLDIEITPSIEYDLDIQWFMNVKKFKLVSGLKTSYSGSIKGSVEADIPLPMLSFDFAGVKMGVFLVIGADGKIKLSYTEKKRFGFDYYEGMSGGPFVKETTVLGNSLSFAAAGRLGVAAKCSAALLCFDMGEVKLEGGGKASATLTPRTSTFTCTDLNAWVYGEASYKVNDVFAKVAHVDEKGTVELLTKNNSPLRWKQHLENGKKVSKCTWGSGSFANDQISLVLPDYWKEKTYFDVRSSGVTVRANDGSAILYVDWGKKASFARDGENGTRWIGDNKTGSTYAAAMSWNSFSAMKRTDEAVDLQTGGKITSVADAYADDATWKSTTDAYLKKNLWSNLTVY